VSHECGLAYNRLFARKTCAPALAAASIRQSCAGGSCIPKHIGTIRSITRADPPKSGVLSLTDAAELPTLSMAF
jgi:hypothetical protein